MLTFDIQADGTLSLITKFVIPASVSIHLSAVLSSIVIVRLSKRPVPELFLTLLVEVRVGNGPAPAVHVIVQTDPGSLERKALPEVTCDTLNASDL